jgi:hypothetical protein
MKISKTLTFGLLGVALAFNAIAEEPTMMYVVGKDGKLITTMNVDDIGKITFKDPFADPEPEAATIRAVNGFWAGDFWGNTLNDVYLEMTDAEVKDGRMQYPGNFISLDLNVKAQEFEKLNIAGNYAPCTDVVPLYPSTFNCDGVTYINSYDASGHMTRHDVTGGSVNIAYAAGTYTIDLHFTFDDRDDYRARYNGPIGFTDDSGTKLSTLTSDYTPSVTSAKAAFGNWGNPSLPSVPLTLTLQGSKDTVQFLLNASKNSANTHDIDGQYVAESKIGVSETDYSVGAAHPGELKSIDGQPSFYGCWLVQQTAGNLSGMAPFTSGYITITHSGTGYTVKYSFSDDADYTISGTYTGTISFDDTTPVDPPVTPDDPKDPADGEGGGTVTDFGEGGEW